jgi:hypothetical protein
MLRVLSAYIRQIPPLTVDGIFGENTRNAVWAAQRYFGLPETGVVNETTWDEIYDQFSGIENTSLRDREVFPDPALTNSPARQHYARSSTTTQFPGKDLSAGQQDPVRQEVIR